MTVSLADMGHRGWALVITWPFLQFACVSYLPHAVTHHHTPDLCSCHAFFSLPSWTLSSRTVSLGKPLLPYFLSITTVRKVRDTVAAPLTHRRCMALRKCETKQDILVKLLPPSYKGESREMKGCVAQLPWVN